MKLSRIRPTTIALFVATFLFFVVGAYTENSGFQAAGLLLGVVTVITAFNQARNRGESSDGDPQ